MNLKLRFALLFTFFVAIVLIVSSCTIYFLYYNYRESEFFERVKSEGLEFNNAIIHDSSYRDLHSNQFITLLRNSTVYDQHVTLLDSAGKIKYKIPDTLHAPLPAEMLAQIRKLDEYSWYGTGNSQFVGLVLKNSGDILVSSGYDRPGFEKLHNLKIILSTVLAGALILTAFISFVFVREAFIPLRKLSVQMKQTTLQNMAQRLPVEPVNDEINDIAKNFNAMLDRLTAAFEFQKSFVFHASHEFRTPLATMLSETESALAQDLDTDEYKKVLASLKEEQQELIELTNSLLLISQNDQVNYAKDWPLVRLDEVLYDTISYAKKMFPRMTINLAFGAIPDDPEALVIKGNDSLLRSMFLNLVKNAYMYSIDQKVSILLESAGDTLLVHFDNTGTQLPADERENILNPFYRGNNALKTKGYGLGLAIVYRFITIHKGTITYTPIANDVNRFSIILPTAPAGLRA